jgi:peroxiredoxin
MNYRQKNFFLHDQAVAISRIVVVICLIQLTAIFSAFSQTRATNGAVQTGSAAPTFVLRSYDGNVVFLRDYCGKLRFPWRQEKRSVVVSFFATWCQPCLKEIAVLHEVAEMTKDKPPVFLLINVGEDTAQVRRFLAASSIRFPILMDEYSTTARAFGVVDKNNRVTLPRLFVIDREGKVAYASQGMENPEEFKKRLLEELTRLE